MNRLVIEASLVKVDPPGSTLALSKNVSLVDLFPVLILEVGELDN